MGLQMNERMKERKKKKKREERSTARRNHTKDQMWSSASWLLTTRTMGVDRLEEIACASHASSCLAFVFVFLLSLFFLFRFFVFFLPSLSYRSLLGPFSLSLSF